MSAPVGEKKSQPLRKVNRMHQRIHATNAEDLILGTNYPDESLFKDKPRGLWYSIDYSWHKWCYFENFYIGTNDFSLDIFEPQILKIDSIEKLLTLPVVSAFKHRIIHWQELQSQYSGFEVTNYEKLKYNSLWGEPIDSHYEAYRCLICNLDCSSGCIWDLSCVRNVTRISNSSRPHYSSLCG